MPLSSFIPSRESLERLVKSLSTRQWWIAIGLGVIGIGSIITGITLWNIHVLVTIPRSGGTHTEGVIGTPRFINPVLALSDTDKDITSLVYGGLMREDSNGDLVPDLAETYNESDDGLTYTFTLQPKIRFQDGQPLTAADVAYTINTLKDPAIKSPRKINWDGVTVETPDAQTVIFHLKQRYAGFLENTTIGIMPMHLWKNLTPEQFSLSNLNLKGVGAGLYEITNIDTTNAGIPTTLSLGRTNNTTYIKKIDFRFYSNQTELETALQNGEVDAISSVDPSEAMVLAKNGYKVLHTPLPRVFSIFLNPTEQPLFADKSVVEALRASINKQALIDSILSGYGTPAEGPVPARFMGEDTFEHASTDTTDSPATILTKGGWKQNDQGVWTKKTKKTTTTLAFSLSTSDIPELKDAARAIQTAFQSAGIQVDLKVYDSGTLNQTVIRPRKYEALFFGQMINHESDLYAFWDSSQRKDPGLNISQYANARVDTLLAKANDTLDQEARQTIYQQINAAIEKDEPALFIYSPEFIYITNGNTQGITLSRITIPADRFRTVRDWYTRVDRVWPIFAKTH